MNLDYQRICESCIPIVEKTAGFIKEQLGRVSSGEIEDKAHNSLVSYVDKTAEKQLVDELSAMLPSAVFLTEEDTVENSEGDLRWIIDPLDGTTNFLHQIPIFSVSVALEAHGEIVVGIVYEVNQSECFYAWKEGGAYLNGNAIKANQEPAIGQTLIATGYPSRNFELLTPYFNVLETIMQKTRGLRRLGSAAVDLAYVASGRFDAFFEYGLNPWDIAAGILLVKEAGGNISDFQGGNNFFYGGEMLASNGMIHQELLEIMSPAFGK